MAVGIALKGVGEVGTQFNAAADKLGELEGAKDIKNTGTRAVATATEKLELLFEAIFQDDITRAVGLRKPRPGSDCLVGSLSRSRIARAKLSMSISGVVASGAGP